MSKRCVIDRGDKELVKVGLVEYYGDGVDECVTLTISRVDVLSISPNGVIRIKKISERDKDKLRDLGFKFSLGGHVWVTHDTE